MYVQYVYTYIWPNWGAHCKNFITSEVVNGIISKNLRFNLSIFFLFREDEDHVLILRCGTNVCKYYAVARLIHCAVDKFNRFSVLLCEKLKKILKRNSNSSSLRDFYFFPQKGCFIISIYK